LSEPSLTLENNKWLADFKDKHGRRPRVLHIGNIANNAYQNAKLLNRLGLDCDVICYNYYHIMSCPEWEDADFNPKGIDQFRPEWSKVKLNGFERPEWFAQGPRDLCINYLLAKRSSSHWQGTFWRFLLKQFFSETKSYRVLRFVYNKLGVLKASLIPKLFGSRIRIFLALGALFFSVFIMISLFPHQVATILLLCLSILFLSAGLMDIIFIRNPKKTLRDPAELWNELCARFKEMFPHRKDILTPADIAAFYPSSKRFAKLLKRYDAVVGYSTDPIIAMLMHSHPYYAFEHGTIRQIPFSDAAVSRLCALAYRMADGVFITNCDNVVAAEKLGLPNYKFIPHMVNEDFDQNLDGAILRKQIQDRLKCDFVLFHPARHHWEDRRSPLLEKGNDIILKGFSKFIHEVCPTTGIVLVDWGPFVDQSKQLLHELAISDNVMWITPQPSRRFSQYMMASDIVADQISFGSFGNIVPKALKLGKPCVIYFDQEVHRWCLPEMPPVLNARTSKDVYEVLRRTYLDVQYRRKVESDGQSWYAKYHSNQVIGETFIEMLRGGIPTT